MNILRKNFIYNNLLGLTNLIVPILVFPYISRVLGPKGVGVVSFAISLTAVFTLIASLGIPIYGIREIAKVKNNKSNLTKVFSELIFIQIVWMLIVLVIYAFWLYFTDTFQDNKIIKYASFFHIIGLIGLINWFFQGLENYKFITMINFIMKVLTLVLLYTLVINKEDYWVYFIVIVISSIVGAITSLIYALKFTKIDFKNLSLKRHFKPIFILFSTQLAIGIYLNLDVIFLKYYSNDVQVGLYTPASKLIKLCLIIVTSLGAVLIPKISLLINQNKYSESSSLIIKSINFVLLITFPIIILLSVLSKDIILIFAGNQFLMSSDLLFLLTPILFFVGLSNIFGMQVLVPTNNENKLMYAVVFGATLSIILNMILIPKFKALGAVYSILITELIIAFVTYLYARKVLIFIFPLKNSLQYLLLSVLLIPVCLVLKPMLDGFLYLVTASVLSLVVYILGLFIIKDQFFKDDVWKPILKMIK